MARTPVPAEKQMLVAGLLATGKTQIEAAKEAGVSRSTISRLLKDESFQAELERRARLEQVTSSEVAAILQDEDVTKEWIASIKSHIEAIEKASVLVQACGFSAVTKGMRRLKDLPDESLKPSDAIALVKIGQELLDTSFAWREEVMGLHEIAERVADAKEA